MIKKKQNLCSFNSSYVIMAYIILALLITYPLVFNICTHIIGSAEPTDPLYHYWYCWWFGEAIGKGHNPYQIYTVLFPVGSVDLLTKNGTCFNALITVPFQKLFGLIPAINISCIILIIFNAYAVYCLVLYITKHRLAAFISGIIISLTPYLHFALSALNIDQFVIGWGLFYLLFFIRTINEKDYKNPLWAGIFLFATTLSFLGYGLVFCLFSVAAILYFSLSKDRLINKSCFKRLVFLVSVYLIGVLPLFIAYSHKIPDSSTEEQVANFPFWKIPKSIDYLSATEKIIVANSLLPNLSNNKFHFFVIFFVLIGILVDREKSGPWLCSAFLFLILSLGPYFVLKNDHDCSINIIPLPGLFYYKLGNFFSRFRFPFRFIIILWISFTIIAGIGLKWFFNRYAKKTASGIILTVIIIGLLFMETRFRKLGSFPSTIGQIPEAPRFYRDILAKEKDTAILSIPITIRKPTIEEEKAFPVPFWQCYETIYQTVHCKRTFAGLWTSAHPLNAYWSFISNNTLLQNLLHWQNDPHADPIPLAVRDIYALEKLGFKYIIVNSIWMRSEQTEIINYYLNKLFGKPDVYSQDYLFVYNVKNQKFFHQTSGNEDWIYLNQPDFAQRLADIEHKLEVFCEDISVLSQAGEFYFKMGEFEKSEKFLTQAVQQEPALLTSWMTLLDIFVAQKRWDKVLFTCGEIRKVESINQKAIMEEFFAQKEKTLSQNPLNPKTVNELAEVYLAHGKPRRAITCLEQVLQYTDQDAETHLLLGKTYQKMGLSMFALSEYKLAKKINPGLTVDFEPVLVPVTKNPITVQ